MTNFHGVNTESVNGPYVAPAAGLTYVGNVCTVSQFVGIKKSNEILKFQQDVQLRLVYSGSIATIGNQVIATTQADICNFVNIIINTSSSVPIASARSFYQRNGWNVSIFIGNTEITADQLHGDIIITMGEDESNTCEFTIFVENPVSFIDSVYDGSKQVIINYYNRLGVHRLITSVVDSPRIDLINKTVTMICSNQRNELIENKMQQAVKTFGRYSFEVQGTYSNVKNEVDLRSTSTPTSVNFDNYNVLNLNSWFAKTVADYTMTSSDIYKREPSVHWQDRSDIINHVEIDLQYKRTRLYHQQRNWIWTAPYIENLDDYILNKYTAPTVEMILEAIDKASWRKIGNGDFIRNWAVQNTLNSNLGYGDPVYYPRLDFDEFGNIKKDASGNNFYVNKTMQEPKTFEVMQASWSAAKQYSQYIDEQYILTVIAPQSVAQNGDIKSNEQVGFEDNYDASAWEDYAQDTPVPAGAVVTGNNYYVDVPEFVPGTRNNAILTSLEIARRTILATHRGTEVTVETKLLPDLQLRHTIQLNTDLISCKGRVTGIQHSLNTMDGDTTTTIVISLFRSTGSSSDTPRISPAVPVYSPDLSSLPTISLGSHYGKTPQDSWNGFIGNKVTYFANGGINYLSRTEFTDEFRVDTPAINRPMVTLQQGATYTISIPNDNLVIDLSW